MRSKVSIIVPLYNQEERLHKCIDSIINQTLQEVEIILVDDGSTDRSGAICDEYTKMDKRVRVIHKKNGGDCSARNIGMKLAQGEYLGFVDSDDYVDNTMFEEMYAVAKKNNIDIVHCGCLYEKGDEVEKLNTGFDKNKILTHSDLMVFIRSFKNDLEEFWFAWRNIYRTELLKEYDIGFDERVKYGADTHFNLQAFYHAKSFYSMNQYLYHYVMNLNGLICTKYKETYLEHLSATYRTRIELCENLNLDPACYVFELSRTVIEKFLGQLLVNAWESPSNTFKTQLESIRNSTMISESFLHYKSSGKLSNSMQSVVYLMKYRMYFLVSIAFVFRFFRSDVIG